MSLIFRILAVLFTVCLIQVKAQDTLHFAFQYEQVTLPYGLTDDIPSNVPHIGLVLSGGGARGLAQLGVIKSLEENDIPFSTIVGTSIGSIVGGLYSAGYTSEDLDSIFTHAPWEEFFSPGEIKRNELFVDQKLTEDKAVLEFRLDGFTPLLPTSINTGTSVTNYLNLLTLNAPIHIDSTFNHLEKDFYAVCTDLVSGSPVVLNGGSLSYAMRASSSVSFLLPPVESDSTLLVDGGLVANIPVKIADSLGIDFKIVINTTSPLRERENLKLPWEIGDQIISIPMEKITQQNLLQSDFTFTPAVNISNTEFDQDRALIEAGYFHANEIIGSLEEKLIESFEKKFGSKKITGCIKLNDNPTNAEKEFLSRLSEYNTISYGTIYYEFYKLALLDGYENLELKLIPGEEGYILDLIEVFNPIVQNIIVDGVSLVSSNNVDEIFAGLKYKPFNSTAAKKAITNLLRVYRKQGYSLTECRLVRFIEGTNTLAVIIDEGRVNNIEISGNNVTDPTVIRREFPFNEGDVFRYSDLEQGLINLKGTGLFKNVEIILEKRGISNLLRIEVDEKTPAIIRFGLRIDNENFTQISVDVRNENFFGTGTEIGAIFTGGLRNRDYILEHKANRIFDSYLTYKVRTYFGFQDINVYTDDSTTNLNSFSRSKTEEYRQQKIGISIGLGTQIQRLGNLILEGRFQRDEIKNVQDYTGTKYAGNITSVKLNLLIDTQNKFPYPDHGFYLNSYYETAQSLFGGDFTYTKVFFDYRGYVPINNYHNLSAKFTIGAGDETMPLSQHFTFGGQRSFFGYRDFEYRGRQLFIMSLAYRYKLPVQIFFDTYIGARYDLGSTWAEKEQIRFKDLRHAIGSTLSFDTPIGPADFSVGRSFYINDGLIDTKSVWGPVYFYFTIGFYY